MIMGFAFSASTDIPTISLTDMNWQESLIPAFSGPPIEPKDHDQPIHRDHMNGLIMVLISFEVRWVKFDQIMQFKLTVQIQVLIEIRLFALLSMMNFLGTAIVLFGTHSF